MGNLYVFKVKVDNSGTLIEKLLSVGDSVSFFFFFKKNHRFITRGVEADRGKYTVPT